MSKDVRGLVSDLSMELQEGFDDNPESTDWVKRIFDNNKVKITYHVNENLTFLGCCLNYSHENADYSIDTWLCEVVADDHLEYESDEMAYDVASKINEYVEPMWNQRLRLFLAGQVDRL